MPRTPLVIEIPALGALDAAPGEIGRRLAEALRAAILKGELKAQERVPSTRTLAGSLGLARGTVSAAYAQLIAEGYLEARAGSATRVAADLTNARREPAPRRPSSVAVGSAANATPPTAGAYTALAARLSPLPSIPFSIAVPEGDVAMDDHWRRLSNRIRATQAAAPSGYPDAQGLPALRSALADYLRKSRAVNCDPANLIITEGTQQGLYLAAKVLLQPGDFCWAEDPAYTGLTAVLEDRGVQVQRVPVDHQGFNVTAALQACPQARAAFVTPSHQYPIGMPLSMARRIALTDWAASHNTWIVEDDYDSELRYAGQPFPAMQGLDRERVIYLGTFSKVLAPSLRLGYIVAPDALVAAFTGARALIGRGSPLSEQHIIAAYMREGYFETHIRRIRGLYGEKRQILIDALRRELPALSIQPADQGMHIVLWLADDVAVAARAQAAGLAVRALSPMCHTTPPLSGLMLGFGGYTAQQLQAGVKKLRQVLSQCADTGPASAPPACGTC